MSVTRILEGPARILIPDAITTKIKVGELVDKITITVPHNTGHPIGWEFDESREGISRRIVQEHNFDAQLLLDELVHTEEEWCKTLDLLEEMVDAAEALQRAEESFSINADVGSGEWDEPECSDTSCNCVGQIEEVVAPYSFTLEDSASAPSVIAGLEALVVDLKHQIVQEGIDASNEMQRLGETIDALTNERDDAYDRAVQWERDYMQGGKDFKELRRQVAEWEERYDALEKLNLTHYNFGATMHEETEDLWAAIATLESDLRDTEGHAATLKRFAYGDPIAASYGDPVELEDNHTPTIFRAAGAGGSASPSDGDKFTYSS